MMKICITQKKQTSHIQRRRIVSSQNSIADNLIVYYDNQKSLTSWHCFLMYGTIDAIDGVELRRSTNPQSSKRNKWVCAVCSVSKAAKLIQTSSFVHSSYLEIDSHVSFIHRMPPDEKHNSLIHSEDVNNDE